MHKIPVFKSVGALRVTSFNARGEVSIPTAAPARIIRPTKTGQRRLGQPGWDGSGWDSGGWVSPAPSS